MKKKICNLDLKLLDSKFTSVADLDITASASPNHGKISTRPNKLARHSVTLYKRP